MKSLKRVVVGSIEYTELKELSKAEETKGALAPSEEDKLMKSVLQNDKKTIDDGKLIADAINQGMNSFTPDMTFENITKNFSIAKNIYGESLIRLLTSYNPSYINKNLGIPEFRKELKQKIEENIDGLKDRKVLNKDGTISETGIALASLILYTEELDNIIPKGILGKKVHKKQSHYGDKEDVRNYKKSDRYRDIAVRSAVRLAIRRGHKNVEEEDLRTFERQSKGSVYVVYGIDASGSMKGKKIEVAKKAGIALAYKAVTSKDKVGVVVFGTDVKDVVHPTSDFSFLLRQITKIRASMQTDFTAMLRKAVEIFPNEKVTKHLVILTDAMPTVGEKPEEETMEEVSSARAAGITISIVGINLSKEGKKLAEKIVQLGEGRLYVVRNLENLDKIVLEDYYSVL
ncbi:VWA domain-containing protein [Candidatus Woesearchaeota archaeon]|nr:VWA domain-containing protein [Candidatus Woesearchaeota archaeon]